MDLVCKLCNGMIKVDRQCPYCGSEMQDGGIISNFYGPYSPYDKIELMPGALKKAASGEKCTHLLVCPVCGADQRVTVDLEPI